MIHSDNLVLRDDVTDEERKKAADTLRSGVQCSICLGFYEDPQLLKTCGHVYCKKCLNQMFFTSAKSIKCPQCTVKLTRRDAMPSTHMTRITALAKSIIPRMHPASETPPLTQLFANRETARERENKLPQGVEAHLQKVEKQQEVTGVETPVPPSASFFKKGDRVTIAPRCWSGMNSEGGAAKVLEGRNTPDGGREYDVKYIVDKRKERSVPGRYLTIYVVQDTSRTARRTSRRSSDGGQKDSTPEKKQTPCLQLLAASTSGARSSSSKSKLRTARGGSEGGARAREGRDMGGGLQEGKETRADEEDGAHGRSGKASPEPEPEPENLGASEANTALGAKRKRVSGMTGGATLGVLPHAPPLSESSTMVIAVSGSNAELEADVRSFTEMSGAKMYEGRGLDVSSVTHLVTTVTRRNISKARTLKYLLALAAGKWIVSPQWIRDSTAACRVLPEKKYVVARDAGSYRDGVVEAARHAVHNGGSLLFQDTHVVFVGDFPAPLPRRAEMEQLVQIAGGRSSSVRHMAALLARGASGCERGSERRIVVCGTSEEKEAALSKYKSVLSPQDTFVLPKFVIDSVANYQLQDVHDAKHVVM